MFKKTIAMLMVATIMVSSPVYGKTNNLNKYRKQAIEIEKSNNLSVVDTNDLSAYDVTHRKGTVLIERTIGRVLNKNKDGRVLNTEDRYYNYISYRNVDCKKGDIIVTYLLYNPENNGEDDIIARWDYIIEK